jgi:hypothetical protein
VEKTGTGQGIPDDSNFLDNQWYTLFPRNLSLGMVHKRNESDYPVLQPGGRSPDSGDFLFSFPQLPVQISPTGLHII